MKFGKSFGLDVELQATSGTESKVRFEFLPMERGQYYLWLVNGGGTYPAGPNEKGIIGMIWKAT